MVAAALSGARAVDADGAWHRSLRNPFWKPPSWVFSVVWTPLHATIAYADDEPLGTASDRSRRTRLAARLVFNLTLNTRCTWLHFGLRNLKTSLAGILPSQYRRTHPPHRTNRPNIDPRPAAVCSMVRPRHGPERLDRPTQPECSLMAQLAAPNWY
ncbi:TspO/MBR family protein [Streptomyces sp. NPDC005209]|uniref:TspO/MBR family protein n=1 Tax=Streptomyces sp. NPDC005209 TaxID=3156715 RepID=UPI00339E0CF9